jgi:hypothetical protein
MRRRWGFEESDGRRLKVEGEEEWFERWKVGTLERCGVAECWVGG